MSLGAPIGPFVLETLAATRELVGGVGEAAVGVNVFHDFRGGSVVELAALGRTEIVGVHVTDVPDLPNAELGDGDRMLPGDGVIPLAEYRKAILSTGFGGYKTLELLNEELWKKPPVDVARIGLATMRRFAGLA